MRDEIRRIALFTSGVAELTRNRAEEIVRDLVKGGDIRSGQASAAVRDLLERSRQNQRDLLALVRGEINNQIQNLGLASKRDIERLERRVTRLEDRAKAPKATTAKSAKSTAPKKTTAKKTSPK